MAVADPTICDLARLLGVGDMDIPSPVHTQPLQSFALNSIGVRGLERLVYLRGVIAVPASLIHDLVDVAELRDLRHLQKQVVINTVDDILAKAFSPFPCLAAEHAEMVGDGGQHHLFAAERRPAVLVAKVRSRRADSFARSVHASYLGIFIKVFRQSPYGSGLEPVVRIQLPHIDPTCHADGAVRGMADAAINPGLPFDTGLESILL